jgi:hypothetical protein
LNAYAAPGNYTDCYVTRIDRSIGLTEFVRGFYSTHLFAIERLILRLAGSKTSSIKDIDALANGITENFAAWSVESRESNQLLLADHLGRTRSWLGCSPVEIRDPGHTNLFFGSAVLKTGKGGPDAIFRAMLPFHKLYSRGLLFAARQNLGQYRLPL